MARSPRHCGREAPEIAPRTLAFSLRSIPGGFAAADGPRDRAVHLEGLAALTSRQFWRQQGDDLLDVLGAIPRADENGVGGLHHEQVADPEQSHLPRRGGKDEVVGCIERGERPAGVVAIAVGGKVAGQCIPTAHVVPVEGRLDHEHRARVLHHGVVHGHLRQRGKALGEHGGRVGRALVGGGESGQLG